MEIGTLGCMGTGRSRGAFSRQGSEIGESLKDLKGGILGDVEVGSILFGKDTHVNPDRFPLVFNVGGSFFSCQGQKFDPHCAILQNILRLDLDLGIPSESFTGLTGPLGGSVDIQKNAFKRKHTHFFTAFAFVGASWGCSPSTRS